MWRCFRLKKIFVFLMLFFVCINNCTYAKEITDIDSKSYVLMDGFSGEILLAKNASEKMPPASITKIMTLLLVMEGIEGGKISYDDIVTVSETAAKHEGSHVFLAVGEQISVKDLLKAVAVASGNDAACALAEHVAGTQERFVSMMNKKAKSLGMHDTFYENCNGLDSTNHLTTAKDIAILTFELSKHKEIFDFTGIWMDTLREGTFDLANTNKLIRFYEGATGMKTGFTSKAGYCLSATAERNGLSLIAVVMNASTSQNRFGDASALLNYGFDNYKTVKLCSKNEILSEFPVKKGTVDKIGAIAENNINIILSKTEQTENVVKKIRFKETNAPFKKGTCIGEIKFLIDGREVGKTNLLSVADVKKISFRYCFEHLFKSCISF